MFGTPNIRQTPDLIRVREPHTANVDGKCPSAARRNTPLDSLVALDPVDVLAKPVALLGVEGLDRSKDTRAEILAASFGRQASTTKQHRRNAQARLGTIAEPLRWRATERPGLRVVLDRHTSDRLSDRGVQSACSGIGEALDPKPNSAPPGHRCKVRRAPSCSRRPTSADQATIGFPEGRARPRAPAPASTRP